MADTTKWTWLGWLNWLVLQWLFVRLARVRDDDGRIVGYQWLVGVLPMTGWVDEYRYVFGGRE